MSSRGDKKFYWSPGNIPILENHSEAKLRLLGDYIKEYLRIVCQNHRMSQFNITLIDGFAGGGFYKDNKDGSPFVMMKAVEKAAKEINDGRKNPININPYYIFVEKEAQHVRVLSGALSDREIDPKCYTLIQKSFNDSYPQIVDIIKKRHPRGGIGVIFFLDQYGYTDVETDVLRHINNHLPNAEVIINIAISHLIEFINDSKKYKQILLKFGIKQHIVDEIIKLHQSQEIDRMYIIEAKFSEGLKQATGFPYFTPYFIEPAGRNHRGYWLLHLAPYYRAHNAMLAVIWKHGNKFRHYGGNGLNLLHLSYKGGTIDTPDLWGATFNDEAKQWHENGLERDLPEYLRRVAADGMPVKNLIAQTCNDTALTVPMYAQGLADMNGKELQILGPSGQRKRTRSIQANDIKMHDIVVPVKNLYLPFAPLKKK